MGTIAVDANPPITRVCSPSATAVYSLGERNNCRLPEPSKRFALSGCAINSSRRSAGAVDDGITKTIAFMGIYRHSIDCAMRIVAIEWVCGGLIPGIAIGWENRKRIILTAKGFEADFFGKIETVICKILAVKGF